MSVFYIDLIVFECFRCFLDQGPGGMVAVRCLRQGPDALWICPVSLRGALSSLSSQGYNQILT